MKISPVCISSHITTQCSCVNWWNVINVWGLFCINAESTRCTYPNAFPIAIKMALGIWEWQCQILSLMCWICLRKHENIVCILFPFDMISQHSGIADDWNSSSMSCLYCIINIMASAILVTGYQLPCQYSGLRTRSIKSFSSINTSMG